MTNAAHSSRKGISHSAASSSLQDLSDSAFNIVFDSSAEALLVMDREGRIRKANQRARELLRLKEIKHGHTDLIAFFSEPSAGRLRSFWAHARASEQQESLDASLLSGFPIRLTLRAILPPHHLLLCLEEGPIVQRAESKSRQLEAELHSVLDSLQVGVILLDPSGRVRFSNPRFGQLFALSAHAIHSAETFEGIEQFVSSKFRDPLAFSAPWKACLNGTAEPGHDELHLNSPSEHRVLERFFRPVLDPEGRSVGWCELYSDVTKQRQDQEKLLQTEKMAALGQLVSGIAHELNNPLTVILGYAQLLLGQGLQPSQLGPARSVYQEAERARRIVKNLLYFARQNRPERTSVDLNEIVERTIALRSYELKVEDIVVECELTPNLPRTLADPYQLQQVILNLVVNAEQALLEDRGRGHISIRTGHSSVGSRRPAGSIFLEVSDDGPGIAPAIASRVFDPFFTTKAAGLGTGLGLSIVYGIVHQHGGEVTFENQRTGGAKFTIELPVVSASEKFESHGPGTSAQADSSPRRFLVVEDEPTVAQLIADVLREEGHHVEAVLDSQEGLTRLSRAEYDLVICDLRMPRLDGPAFYDALVRSGSPVRDKVVFITGDTLSARSLKFLEEKKLPYLAKPFLVEELKLAVHNVISIDRNQGDGETSPYRSLRA